MSKRSILISEEDLAKMPQSEQVAYYFAKLNQFGASIVASIDRLLKIIPNEDDEDQELSDTEGTNKFLH